MSDYLIQRNGYYYYFRRVPRDFSDYDTRKHIKISLKTKDKTTARKRAIIQNEAVEKFWRDLIMSDTTDKTSGNLYKKAVKTARIYGFSYKDISEISQAAPLSELVDRMLAIHETEEKDSGSKLTRNALTGTATPQTIKLSETWDIYIPRCADRLLGKTDHQVRKWENPRRLALENFIKAIGNKDIHDINRKDILKFQQWWLDRVTEEGMNPVSANRNLSHAKDILDTVYTTLDIHLDTDIETLFAKVKLKTQGSSRKSYEASYVQSTFIDTDVLSGLNDEARALFYMMADTGARVAEITGLLPEDICLDTDIPYIHIRSNSRGGLKTTQSERQIPLVGVSLQAAKLYPEGLSRYANADSVSTTINKYLRENDLNPTKDHSLYSLRHTFKDRLRDVQAPEEVIDNLMGHKSRGPKYGRGHILETKLEWLERIAFKGLKTK